MALVHASRRYPLSDIVLAVLSHAATGGRTRIPLFGLYRAFGDLIDEASEEFPPMRFSRTPFSTYSKRLEDAIQALVGYAIELPNPRLRHVETAPTAAARHLRWLHEKHGDAFTRWSASVTDRFLEKLAANTTE